MTVTELLDLFRVEVQDVETPYLWSDAFIIGVIDEAQKQFCRQTYGIADATSFTLSILANGTQWYDIDPKVLKIRQVHDSLGIEPMIIPIEKMGTYGFKFDGKEGPLQALITGMEKGKVRAYPVPNEAKTLELSVFRLPETIEGVNDDFEIDEQHVRNLLYWMKFRAYDVQDTEVYNPKKAMEFRAKFDEYCARALNEQSRYSHRAGTVTYGGI